MMIQLLIIYVYVCVDSRRHTYCGHIDLDVEHQHDVYNHIFI